MSLCSIDMEDSQVKPTSPNKAKYSDKGDGEKRAYLRVFETPPSQMLNAYGQSSFVKKTDAEVWEGLVEPLPTGAMYGTELASSSVERRGVGLNRAFHALVEYCSLQTSEEARKANEYCLKETEGC